MPLTNQRSVCDFQMSLRGAFCSQVSGISYFFLSSSCTAPARHVCGFCSWVKYHATNSCFTGSFRRTAGSVASCRIRASGVINCSREFTPLTPRFSFFIAHSTLFQSRPLRFLFVLFRCLPPFPFLSSTLSPALPFYFSPILSS